MADAPEQADVQQEEKPKSKLLFIVIGFVVLLAVVGGVAFFMFGGSGEDAPMIEIETEEPGYMYEFEAPFVGNLSPPDDQYMFTANITLEITPRGSANEAEALAELGVDDSDNAYTLMPKVKQIIYDELSSKTRVEINSAVGKENIRNRIKNDLNFILRKAEIKDVYMRVMVP